MKRAALLIAITVETAVASALLLSVNVPRMYESSIDFYLTSDAQAYGLAQGAGAAAPVLSKETQKWAVAVLKSAALREVVHRSVPRKSAAALFDDVDVDVGRNHLVRLSVRDRDPQLAATVANAYPDALREFLRSASAVRGQGSMEALEKALSDLDLEAEQTILNMKSLISDERSPAVQTESFKLLERRVLLETEIEKTRARLEGIERRIGASTEQLKEEATLRGAPLSATQARLIKDISDIEADLAAARAEFEGKFSAQHPKVRALTLRLLGKQAELAHEAAGLKEAQVKPADWFSEQLRREILGLRKDRIALNAEIARGTAALAELSARIASRTEGLLREQKLAADLSRLERMRDALRQRQRDMRTLAVTVTSPVVIVGVAIAAAEAKFPVPWLNAVVAAALGLLGGTFIAFTSRGASPERTRSSR